MIDISEIKQKYSELLEKKGRIEEEIRKLQESCTHPDDVLVIEHRANTSNYDPSPDVYWTDYRCNACGKTWTTFSGVLNGK